MSSRCLQIQMDVRELPSELHISCFDWRCEKRVRLGIARSERSELRQPFIDWRCEKRGRLGIAGSERSELRKLFIVNSKARVVYKPLWNSAHLHLWRLELERDAKHGGKLLPVEFNISMEDLRPVILMDLILCNLEAMMWNNVGHGRPCMISIMWT
ncbi:Uncharacterized protein Adt_40767 [Abeliophyllum distichum]|uniref:Uncharacterized protein n=1 Tax=Abeliophyllum distichum TaxID=126358 RepID=A0ABD1PLX8_9LAMI